MAGMIEMPSTKYLVPSTALSAISNREPSEHPKTSGRRPKLGVPTVEEHGRESPSLHSCHTTRGLIQRGIPDRRHHLNECQNKCLTGLSGPIGIAIAVAVASIHLLQIGRVQNWQNPDREIFLS